MSAPITTTSTDPGKLAPPNALVLIELLLPEQQCGLYLARQLQQSRPDLICIVWSPRPAPLYVWAAMEYKIYGLLDKTMPISDFFYWLDHAITKHTAWPGHLIAQARQWDEEVAARLRALKDKSWTVWAALLRGETNSKLISRLGWSPRTLARWQAELYAILGVNDRLEAIHKSWKWNLIDAHKGKPAWSRIIRDFFPA